MRVTYLNGQTPLIIDLGPILTPASLPDGNQGQVLGYGPGGVPQAINLPDGTLPPGTEGQLLTYDDQGQPVAADPTIPLTTANW